MLYREVMGLVVLLLTFCAMELLSYAVHRYLFHGVLWRVHKSHHFPQHGGVERNDLFSLFFALVAAVLVIVGAADGDFKLWMGLGITLYGLVYFIFHDVVIHRRIRTKWTIKNRYLQRVVRAHKLHHKDLSQRGSEAYGLLWVPKDISAKHTDKTAAVD